MSTPNMMVFELIASGQGVFGESPFPLIRAGLRSQSSISPIMVIYPVDVHHSRAGQAFLSLRHVKIWLVVGYLY
ncbi:hypothetical protein [Spirosoma pollinicola]|uniref:Uncharacterized protein n=1 Tax=Spirosoma pollinicola TaxID=2057025 RepID=A0A2K8Z7J8_9BACT|nr:hypothetical protein [Spirosoma pollinicola]AUD05867.1 hypothetical protein CWM47_30880 [Spirosoma pollinicola]